jgi:predicted Rossmann fold nucleotide-binding protein DprA/Smf involved in DNA uptake
MHTVSAADAIGVPVLAVPGSVKSPPSEGTNYLIQSGGAAVATDVHDVLVALELSCVAEGTALSASARKCILEPPDSAAARERSEARRARLVSCDADARKVFKAVADTPTSVEATCRESALEFGVAAVCLDQLEEMGLVRCEGSDWHRV